MEALNTALLAAQDKSFSRPSPTWTPSSTEPPPSPLEQIKQERDLEEKARKLLVEDGCPPCYPTGLEYPLELDRIPEQHKAIIEYWNELAVKPGLLYAQWLDWVDFRSRQVRIRQQFRRNFQSFQEIVLNRRQRHGLQDDVNLRLNPQEQDQLENWIEFQDFHLMNHESAVQSLDNTREALDAERKKLNPDTECVNMLIRIFESSEKKIQVQGNLLRWIENQRIAFITAQHPNRQSPTVKDKAQSSSSVLGERQRTAQSVLSSIRSEASKTPSSPPPERRRLLRSERNVAGLNENVALQPVTAPLRPNRASRLSRTVPRSSKRMRSAKGSLKPPSTSRPQGRPKAKSRQRDPIQQSAPDGLRRSLRKSKLPDRFRPG